LNIRQKLQEQRRAQNRRADKMMRRRMEGLSHMGGGPSLAASAAPLFPQMHSSNSHANLQAQQRPIASINPLQHASSVPQLAGNVQYQNLRPHGSPVPGGNVYIVSTSGVVNVVNQACYTNNGPMSVPNQQTMVFTSQGSC
jgi:hypothetical protein